MSDTRYRGAELEPEFWSTEEELRARVRQQEATGRLGLAALSRMDLAGLMDEVVHAVAGMLGVEYSKILELMPDGVPSHPTPVLSDRAFIQVGEIPAALKHHASEAVQGTVARSGEVLMLACEPGEGAQAR
jgi:hypothetical protein